MRRRPPCSWCHLPLRQAPPRGANRRRTADAQPLARVSRNLSLNSDIDRPSAERRCDPGRLTNGGVRPTVATMFASVLIANRGEIACRIARTAKRLGMRTIAVYSQADANALHVRRCDEAHLLGPAPAASSYLAADRLIEIAQRTGAACLHPGYGFLSGDPD